MSTASKHKSTLISFVAGAALGALALAGSQSIGITPQSSAPTALDNLRQSGVIIRPLGSGVTGINTWELDTETSETTTQLAITIPGADAFIIGELFDGNGNRLTDDLLGNASRERLRYNDMHVRSQWLPGLNEDSTTEAVYLMADISHPSTQALWVRAQASADSLPPIRIIPTPFFNVNGFESALDVFSTYHHTSPDAATTQTLAYLKGEREVPDSQKENPRPSPLAVSAMSTNSNLHHQLRIGTEPTIFQHSTDGKVDLYPFQAWLDERLGQKSFK